MPQNSPHQTFVLLLVLNGGLLWLIRDVNHVLSPWGLWLWLPALLLLMPVFFLTTGQSFLTALAFAGMTEAWAPVLPGRILFLWLLLWLVLAFMRERIRREQIWHLTLLTITVNTAFFLIWHAQWLWQSLFTLRFWGNAVLFSFLNALAIALLLPVWIRIQVWFLLQVGWDEEHEPQ